MPTLRETFEGSLREKRGQWIGVAVILVGVVVLFIWMGATGWLEPLPREPTEASATAPCSAARFYRTGTINRDAQGEEGRGTAPAF